MTTQLMMRMLCMQLLLRCTFAEFWSLVCCCSKGEEDPGRLDQMRSFAMSKRGIALSDYEIRRIKRAKKYKTRRQEKFALLDCYKWTEEGSTTIKKYVPVNKFAEQRGVPLTAFEKAQQNHSLLLSNIDIKHQVFPADIQKYVHLGVDEADPKIPGIDNRIPIEQCTGVNGYFTKKLQEAKQSADERGNVLTGFEVEQILRNGLAPKDIRNHVYTGMVWKNNDDYDWKRKEPLNKPTSKTRRRLSDDHDSVVDDAPFSFVPTVLVLMVGLLAGYVFRNIHNKSNEACDSTSIEV